MGTAGAYKFAEDLIREPTVVFNGDILTDLDLKTVIREHTEHQATATIVLTPVDNPSSYGLVETESEAHSSIFGEAEGRGITATRSTPERTFSSRRFSI